MKIRNVPYCAVFCFLLLAASAQAQENVTEMPVQNSAAIEVATEAPNEAAIEPVTIDVQPVTINAESIGDEMPASSEKATEENVQPEAAFFYDVAVLQGLNKVTARISEIEAPVGTSARFGNLEIVVSRCWKSAPTEQPENAARMNILERRPDEAPVEVFNGWMFSSSPSLSGLEHPVYDIVVLSCTKRKMGDNT